MVFIKVKPIKLLYIYAHSVDQGYAEYELRHQISSDALIDGSQIDFSAGTEIEMQAGFEVKLGAQLHAFIDGCQLDLISNLVFARFLNYLIARPQSDSRCIALDLLLDKYG